MKSHDISPRPETRGYTVKHAIRILDIRITVVISAPSPSALLLHVLVHVLVLLVWSQASWRLLSRSLLHSLCYLYIGGTLYLLGILILNYFSYTLPITL